MVAHYGYSLTDTMILKVSFWIRIVVLSALLNRHQNARMSHGQKETRQISKNGYAMFITLSIQAVSEAYQSFSSVAREKKE